MALTRVTSKVIQDGTISTADLSTTSKSSISGSFRGELSSSVHLRQVASTISGSLGSNASVIRSLDRTTISGSIPQALSTTSSPTFNNITATGTLTAQEIHTEFTSASILFTSGSTKTGNSTDDIHQMTGSLNISGSFNVDNGTSTVNALTAESITTSGNISGSSTSTGSFGAVGIGGSASEGGSKLGVDGNIEILGGGNKLFIPRASDGALTTSIFSRTGNNLTLSGAGSSGGQVEFIPSSANSSAVTLTIESSGRMVASSVLSAGQDYLDGDASLYLANAGSDGTMIKFGDTNAGLVYGGSGTGTFKLMQRQNTTLSFDASRNATFVGNIVQSASGNLRHSLIAGGSGEAVLLLQANNSTGDSFIRWETNATTFSMGFDNSDSDKFILSAGSDPHSNSVINIQPDGSSIAVDKPISFGGVVQLLDVAQSIDFIQSGAINFDSNGDQTGRVLTIGSNRTGDSGGTTNVTFEESGNTIFSGDGKVGIGQGSPTNSPLEVNLTQSNGTAGSSGFAHFGSNGNTDGYIQGISLGYRESNANYRKIAIAVRGRGDGATRSDLCLLVDTANDAASATLQDAKLTIDGLTGATTLRDGIRFSATNGADPTGDDHLDVPIKFAAYTEAVDSTDVSNGSVDLDLDIYRDNYLSLNALLFDSNTNVVHAGLPSDESWLKEITVFAAGGVRVYFGSSVAVGDTVKLLVAYYGNTG